MVRCPGCDALVSEWAATCSRCGGDLSGAPLIDPAGSRDLAAAEAPRRRRWRGPVIGAVAIAVGATAALAAATGGPSRAPAAPAPVLASLPYGSPVGRYLPPSREQAGEGVVPVTLLDGRRFQLSYPPQLGVIGSLEAAIEDKVTLGAAEPTVLRVIATRATVAAVFGSAHPRRSYRASDGSPVLEFDGPPRSSTSYLVFRFGPWLLSVVDAADRPGGPQPLTDRDRAVLASSIDGSEDAAGYLVLSVHSPVAIAPADTTGSVAVFGAGSTVDDPQIDIEDGYCGHAGSDTAARRRFPAQGGAGVAWCDPATGLHIDATGTNGFVNAVAGGLSVAALPAVDSPVPRP